MVWIYNSNVTGKQFLIDLKISSDKLKLIEDIKRYGYSGEYSDQFTKGNNSHGVTMLYLLS
jgi:hypothetical protein